MAFLGRLLKRGADAETLRPLYDAIVALARTPRWYLDGGVADTLDGRFDMLSSVLAFVLIRLEREGEAGREPMARLAELFISDMDGQLRQQGIGDIVVGKHVGRMMATLGGRLDAYRTDADDDLTDALERNVHRAPDTPPAARDYLASEMRALRSRIGDLAFDDLLAGRLPGGPA